MNTAVVDIDFVEDLGIPPIPCIDDMTEEEFDAMIDEALASVKAGRTVSLEKLRMEMSSRYGFEF